MISGAVRVTHHGWLRIQPTTDKRYNACFCFSVSLRAFLASIQEWLEDFSTILQLITGSTSTLCGQPHPCKGNFEDRQHRTTGIAFQPTEKWNGLPQKHRIFFYLNWYRQNSTSRVNSLLSNSFNTSKSYIFLVKKPLVDECRQILASPLLSWALMVLNSTPLEDVVPFPFSETCLICLLIIS